jgi:hypothetical protein
MKALAPMKTLTRKLVLNKETIRILTERESEAVVGGTYTTCTTGCGPGVTTTIPCGTMGSCSSAC